MSEWLVIVKEGTHRSDISPTVGNCDVFSRLDDLQRETEGILVRRERVL